MDKAETSLKEQQRLKAEVTELRRELEVMKVATGVKMHVEKN